MITGPHGHGIARDPVNLSTYSNKYIYDKTERHAALGAAAICPHPGQAGEKQISLFLSLSSMTKNQSINNAQIGGGRG